ncbi:putative anti-sigma-28 factor FlgM [Caballeronia fortuita]|uniref:Negative regulator of flagellin synthesis n=1 Tax=Caballeronia fortuita TaxID=1777138 RepID=A0A158C983_9BURK|nr:flagellar biosynthesis anti-sigma factor FlgM [Caballeronia fortuita]SAK78894.1 putative anti-sigma-28 factor FlgM [Caballeronia fortuita]
MKIETSSNNAVTILQPAAVRAIGGQQGGAASASSSTVNLSPMSTLRVSNESDIDTAKVASIKATLADGSYRPDSARIADGMLSAARDMLGARMG